MPIVSFLNDGGGGELAVAIAAGKIKQSIPTVQTLTDCNSCCNVNFALYGQPCNLLP